MKLKHVKEHERMEACLRRCTPTNLATIWAMIRCDPYLLPVVDVDVIESLLDMRATVKVAYLEEGSIDSSVYIATDEEGLRILRVLIAARDRT